MCSECDRIIKGKYIKLGDKYYHENCYSCYDCHIPFGRNTCYTLIINGKEKNFCEEHYKKRNKRICKICNKPIYEDLKQHKSDYYHQNCFKCSVCNCILFGSSYLEENDKFYCLNDYPYPHICNECNGRIFHDGIIGLGKFYHKCCLKCDKCQNPIKGDYFIKNDSILLCQDDYKREKIID